jgi:hypothetical protein
VGKTSSFCLCTFDLEFIEHISDLLAPLLAAGYTFLSLLLELGKHCLEIPYSQLLPLGQESLQHF